MGGSKIQTIFEDLILVQDERWRRGLGMQVERGLCIAQGNSKHEYRSPKQIPMFKIPNSKQVFGKLEF